MERNRGWRERFGFVALGLIFERPDPKPSSPVKPSACVSVPQEPPVVDERTAASYRRAVLHTMIKQVLLPQEAKSAPAFLAHVCPLDRCDVVLPKLSEEAFGVLTISSRVTSAPDLCLVSSLSGSTVTLAPVQNGKMLGILVAISCDKEGRLASPSEWRVSENEDSAGHPLIAALRDASGKDLESSYLEALQEKLVVAVKREQSKTPKAPKKLHAGRSALLAQAPG